MELVLSSLSDKNKRINKVLKSKKFKDLREKEKRIVKKLGMQQNDSRTRNRINYLFNNVFVLYFIIYLVEKWHIGLSIVIVIML